MKKLLLPAALLFICLSTLQGEVLGYSYAFSAPTLAGQKQYADPGFAKLAAPVPGEPVIWRYRDNGKKPIVIRCEFLPGTRLSQLKIGYFRPHAVRKHTINYGIRNIKVTGITPDGRKLPIGGAVLNQPYAKPDGEPEKGTVTVALEKTPVAAAEVHFTGNNGRLALYSMTFSGEKPAPRAEDLTPSPWTEVIASAGNALRARREGECFILENRETIFAVNPALGGTVTLAYDRERKVNLIRPALTADDWGPFFQDRFYPGGTRARDAFRGVRFTAEPPEVTPEKVTLRLRGRGRNAPFTEMLIEKDFTLRRDSPVLEVAYALRNLPESVVPMHCGFWCCGGVESRKGYTMITPGSRGVTESGFFPGWKEFPELSANWCAVRTPGDDLLSAIFPNKYLKNFCFWTSGMHRGTMECKFGVYAIKAGEALRFTAFLVPFGGMGVPDAVSPHAAGAIRDGRVIFRLFDAGPCEAEFFAGFLKNGRPVWKLLQRRSFTAPGKLFETGIDWRKADARRVILRRKGAILLQMEQAAPGKSFRLASTLAPLPESRGSGTTQGLGLNFNSTKIKSPAWPWAIPLAGKAPKILGINYRFGGTRDLVELALRTGIGFDTHFISGRWTLSGAQDLTEERCVAELEKVLKKPYDCFLVSGDVWKKFTSPVKKALVEKVKEGTGLILVAPEGLPPELTGLCKILPGVRTPGRSPWKKGVPSPVTAGLPFGMLPPTAVTPCAVSGKILIEAGGRPLLAEAALGKGKVFIFTYPAAESKTKLKRGSCFLPRMDDCPALPDWAYHEYQLALLARVVCAAAGRRSPVLSCEAALKEGALELTVTAAEAAKLRLLCRLRDRFSRPAGEARKEFEVRPGRNTLKLALPPPPMRGLYAADLQLRSPGGVEWWGAVAGNAPGPQITALSAEEKVYRKTDILKGEVRHTPGKGLTLKIRASDCFGNCFAETDSARFAFPLGNCAGPSGRITAELLEEGVVRDRREHRFELFFTPDPMDFNIAFGWPSLSIRAQVFNFPVFIQRLKAFGITCLNGDRYALDNPAAERALRDAGLPWFSTQTYGFLGTKKPYDRNLVPKHKFDLVRTPCLSSEKFRKQLAADSARLYPGHRLGALLVAGPDESNMFAQWDGCFTPDCRAALRRWLKKEYGSLGELNASWQCDFKSWEEVTAMTIAEVRNRRSFAPWVDHRTFNDWNRADALRVLAENIAKTAPLRYSFSGTQETNPFNAWDWYRMMPLLGGVSSYYGEQTVQHRSFARGRFYQMPWIGYDSPYRRMDRQLWIALMNGATGVNLYGASFYIRPDYTFCPTAADLIRVLDRYRKGPVQALQCAALPDPPVALHYTPASLKVNEVLGLTALRQSAVAGIRSLLGEKNLSYRYLAYGEIEKGDFKGVKVLFLPFSTALSPGEVRALETFVREGGVLVTDMRCGTYDAHGAPAGMEGIGKLFGIGKPGTARKLPGDLRLGKCVFPVRCYESGIVPAPGTETGGTNPDGSPALLVRKLGRGMTVYAGAAVFSAWGDLQEVRYSKANAPAMAALLALLDRVLGHARVTAPVRVPGLRSAEVLVRECGSLRFAGIGRNYEESANLGTKPERRKVLLDRNCHVYDLFRRKYLGFGDSFDFDFRPDSQEIFALLPYRVREIRCETAGPGLQVRARIVPDKGVPGTHTLRFELTDPAGMVRKEYSAWLRTDAWGALWRWTPPLNALPGVWKLNVTDTISGASALVEKEIRR